MYEMPTANEVVLSCTTGASEREPSVHVLLADSNERTRAARARQLRDAGLRVSAASTSFEAIVKASCHVPDVILLDRSISTIEAAQTSELLTTCPVTSHIPVIPLTAGRPVPKRVLAGLRRRP